MDLVGLQASFQAAFMLCLGLCPVVFLSALSFSCHKPFLVASENKEL